MNVIGLDNGLFLGCGMWRELSMVSQGAHIFLDNDKAKYEKGVEKEGYLEVSVVYVKMEQSTNIIILFIGMYQVK